MYINIDGYAKITNVYKYSKSSLKGPLLQIDHSPISTTLFGSQMIAHTISLQFYSKPSTSLNGTFKVGHMVGRFKEFVLYIKYI